MADEQRVKPSAKGAFVSDLQVGQTYTLQLAVAERSMRTTKKGQDYIAGVLVDRTGRVEFRVWNNPEVAFPVFAVESVVKVEAMLEEWEGQRQLNIYSRYRLCAPDAYDLADFVPTTPESVDNLWDGLEAAIGDVAEEALQEFLTGLVRSCERALRESPAAMVYHHAYRGGLLEHIVSMLQVVDLLCQHYTRLNRDLLIAGVILHDIGKLEELRMGLTSDYTDDGRLVGHVAQGLTMLQLAVLQFGHTLESETVRQLRHMLVSHHGRTEWGALVEPMTPEAIALHCIDLMDTRLFACFAALDKVPVGESWSEYSHGRRYYKERRDQNEPSIPDGDGRKDK